jgi:hypothetical protein
MVTGGMAHRAEREEAPRTRVAVVGTLAEFHREPVPYDLAALVRLIQEQRPDLLCLDIAAEQWASGAFDDLPPEYRDALIPLADQTDIVVVPVAGGAPPAEPVMAAAWRGATIRMPRRWLGCLQRTMRGPATASHGPRHDAAAALYWLTATLAGRRALRAWRRHTERLVERICEAARRDPGCHILVAVNVRHGHHVERALRRRTELRLVPYQRLMTDPAEPARHPTTRDCHG